MKNPFLLLLIICFFSQTAFPQERIPDSSLVHNWTNSVYIFAGYGYPQGLRGEIGYNFIQVFTLAVTAGIGDSWSRDPEEGTIGFLGKINLMVPGNISPYLLVGYGGTLTIFGGPDTYTLVNAGARINLSRHLNFCPEVGFTFTSRHISGGSGVFGSSPEITEEKTRFSFVLGMEVDI